MKKNEFILYTNLSVISCISLIHMVDFPITINISLQKLRSKLLAPEGNHSTYTCHSVLCQT